MPWLKAVIVLLVFCVPISPALPSVTHPTPAPQIRPTQAAVTAVALPLSPQSFVSDEYEFPFKNAERPRISSGFGWRIHPIFGDVRHHYGIDFPKPFGTPVYPARSGIVSFSGWKRGYGWMVEIRHGDGCRTIYGHLARAFVATGQLVHKDILIGLVGSSGLSTGPHLHFEFRDTSGRALDPLSIISRR